MYIISIYLIFEHICPVFFARSSSILFDFDSRNRLIYLEKSTYLYQKFLSGATRADYY